MAIDRSLIAFSLMGARWVLDLLIVLSMISVGVMLERAFFYLRHRLDTADLSVRLQRALDTGDTEAAKKLFASIDAMEARVLTAGLRGIGRGASVGELMDSELAWQKTRFERRLMFLGTLGNNAPFVGLFGTVLGIIQAFHDLALNDPSRAASSAQVVMAGISEALVATAVGLAVALPAVVAFNYFKGVVKQKVAATESLAKLLTAYEQRLTGALREAA
jgi:biopolymer transport protein ExbB